jgi:DNA adenine methylase
VNIETPSSAPILKWVGGKSRLLTPILESFPKQYGDYFEPFLGGGAVFFRLARQGAHISDINEYQAIASDPAGVKAAIETLQKSFDAVGAGDRKAWHAHLRDAFNSKTLASAEQAAALIGLNKTSFNGLYRENSKGDFNVPFNKARGRVKFIDEEKFDLAASLLSSAVITNEDFAPSARRAKPGDLVYFDPPYVPISVTSSFTGYNKGGFGESEQLVLRDLAIELASRGVKVVLSNSYTDWILDHYSSMHFTISKVDIVRGIAASPESRGIISEALIVSK